MDPGRFTDSFGLFILRLEPLVSGPDAVWRHPLETLADIGQWLTTGGNGIIVGSGLRRKSGSTLLNRSTIHGSGRFDLTRSCSSGPAIRPGSEGAR